jgi:hypothetical protein
MKMDAVVETRVGKIDKVSAGDWHLSCVQLHQDKYGKKCGLVIALFSDF